MQVLKRIVTAGLEAARILNNLTDQKVNVSATVVLRCDAAGKPAPLVLWTKNNLTVVEGSGEAGWLFIHSKRAPEVAAAVRTSIPVGFQV